MIPIVWFLTKNSKTISITDNSISREQEKKHLLQRIKAMENKNLPSILPKHNIITKKKSFQTPEVSINIKTLEICKQLILKWQQERKEKEEKGNYFLPSYFKTSYDDSNLKLCWRKLMKMNKVYNLSVKIDFWTIFSMNLSWWCFTVSIHINLEMTWLSFKLKLQISWTMMSFLNFFLLIENPLTSNTLIKIWLKQEN